MNRRRVLNHSRAARISSATSREPRSGALFVIVGMLFGAMSPGALAEPSTRAQTRAAWTSGSADATSPGPLQPGAMGIPDQTCVDGRDNDGDGSADLLDSECTDVNDGVEDGSGGMGTQPTCEDGRDNDRDGRADLLDSECQRLDDGHEDGSDTAQNSCEDGFDNDGDGSADGDDSECRSAEDGFEDGSGGPAEVSCGSPGVDDRCEAFVARYDNPGSHGTYSEPLAGVEGATSVAAGPTGVYLTGLSYDNGTQSFDIATVAFDPVTGRQLWLSRYDGPGGIDDEAVSIVLSPDGSRLYVTGRQDWCYVCNSQGDFDSEKLDGVTLALDAATGRKLWAKRFGSADSLEGPATSVLSHDGSVLYVGGSTCGREGPDSCDHRVLARQTLDGKLLWSSRYDAGAYDSVFLGDILGVDPQGERVYMSGMSCASADTYGSCDYATVAYDAATGAQSWVATHDIDNSSQDYALDLGVSPDGSLVFVTGQNNGTGQGDNTVAYRAATGEVAWGTSFGAAVGRFAGATDLDVNPRGGLIYVTGYTGSSTDGDLVTVALDAASGARAWAADYGTGSGRQEGGTRVAVSPDGSTVYSIGYGENFDPDRNRFGVDAITVALDSADGAQLWAARYNSSADGADRDLVGSIAFNGNGRRAFVAGGFDYGNPRNRPQNKADYGLLAYDGSGDGAQQRPQVKLRVSDSTPHRGERLKLYVRLAACSDPAARAELMGTDVVLKRRTGDRFETFGRKALDSQCKAVFTNRARFRTANYRAAWPKQRPDYQRGKSRTIEVVTHN